ncbi:EAL domain-containing protein [Aeromonas rivipollensis]|uniref:EAL domain-containing protein n=1 Tax=Aeromonas rivipollensis TaxID=948519 RepID=A0AAW9Y7B7_9GAMM|nr:EAL domain-containing protein [Aeromonas rivipollensis]NEX73598.1 EAL domain-containing protein [Aeromonas rivipollensis]
MRNSILLFFLMFTIAILFVLNGHTLIERKVLEWRVWQQSKIILSQQKNRKLALDSAIGSLLHELDYTCSISDKAKLSATAMRSRYIMLLGVLTKDDNTCTSLGNEFSFSLDKKITNQQTDGRTDFFKVGNIIDAPRQLATAYTNSKGTLFFILGTDSFSNFLDNTCTGCFYVEFLVDGNAVFDVGDAAIKDEQYHNSYDYLQDGAHHAIRLYAGEALRINVKKYLRDQVFKYGTSLFIVFLVVVAIVKRKNNSLYAKLKRAIKVNEIYPHYQPVFNVECQRYVGAEVLVRWKYNNERISPLQFIPYAEEKKLIIPITELLIKRTTLDMQKLPNNLWYSINVSAKHFVDEGLIATLEKYREISAERISFEITERHPISDIESAKKQIDMLCSQGFNFKLDDFGTGYGGVAYLQKLGIRCIKIDKMFVDTIGTEDFKFGVLESIIAFGIESNYEMIAEGVETKEQADYLYSKGVFLHQGFYYAKPMSINKLLAFFNEESEMKDS